MMMNKKSLWSSVSVLIVAVLAIMAFIRGHAQTWLLAVSFSAWAAYAVVAFLIPFIKAQVYHYKAKKIRKQCEKQIADETDFTKPKEFDTVSRVLLRHVNYRISAYLQSAYPDATWEWREDFPERIAAEGGTGRIQLFGVSDFNYADVTCDQNAAIRCSLLKITPLSQVGGVDKTDQPESGGEETPTKKSNPVDPQIWYEMQGRKVLETIITDLASRGHSGLTIRENGEIAIKQADREIVKPAFESVPEKMYWSRLTKVFEREGLAASITADGIALSW